MPAAVTLEPNLERSSDMGGFDSETQDSDNKIKLNLYIKTISQRGRSLVPYNGLQFP